MRLLCITLVLLLCSALCEEERIEGGPYPGPVGAESEADSSSSPAEKKSEIGDSHSPEGKQTGDADSIPVKKDSRDASDPNTLEKPKKGESGESSKPKSDQKKDDNVCKLVDKNGRKSKKGPRGPTPEDIAFTDYLKIEYATYFREVQRAVNVDELLIEYAELSACGGSVRKGVEKTDVYLKLSYFANSPIKRCELAQEMFNFSKVEARQVGIIRLVCVKKEF
ncbi:unnamed protein product [Cylicocyclus nassatus]|uniref:Uncharacterized protein n=1 Tax=Cylicocyclus nassatus TaxID=53992 RepID=A0AA36DS44_CYLNA|nr:unnamed protein product [Cylicocyclus nassatus]